MLQISVNNTSLIAVGTPQAREASVAFGTRAVET